MLQVIQSLRTGQTDTLDVPAPAPATTGLLIRTHATLLSAGTERMLIEFGKAGWISKARQQPDKVRMVLDKLGTDGLAATCESIRAKLDQPVPLGYSNAGIVLEPAPGTGAFRAGDRVLSNGPHAQVVRVPHSLCARIPDNVPDEAAAFGALGAIALQGIRLADPTLGETVAVIGLGLIGLLTVQLLSAQGCRVIGIDFDRRKLQMAESFGAEIVDLSGGQDPITASHHFSRGRGVDAVIVTASTKSNEPLHQAALMCRRRGRIVLVGVAGLNLSRDDFYKKELSFQVSCSCGPGRYDPSYEHGGNDYPVAHVRWTAQRNFEAVLDMISAGKLQVESLITHRIPFHRAADAYRLLDSDEFYLGILLEYPQRNVMDVDLRRRTIVLRSAAPAAPADLAIAFVGAGSHATKVLIPAFLRNGVRPAIIASEGGLSAAYASRKFGFAEATTDVNAILANPSVHLVAIATRHDSHASLVCQALRAGKHVFVEKPLAVQPAQLDAIEETWRTLREERLLMVGFNRRFSPHVARMRELLATVHQPKTFIYTINAGCIPPDHWTQRPDSGGRILGEACHFIDLLRYLAQCPARQVQTVRQGSDTVSIGITYDDGSTGTIHYLANGHRSFPKERLEVFVGGRILVLDNFRKLRGHGWPSFQRMNLWRQNKGAAEMAAALIFAIRTGGPSPIPFSELIEVTRTTMQAASLSNRCS